MKQRRRVTRGVPLLLMVLLLANSEPGYLVDLAAAQADLRFDLPRLVEIDELDPRDARVKRFYITARGVLGQEFPIPDSQNFFCTLTHAHNMVLNYYPEKDEWVFNVQADPKAQYAAGGLATCVDLGKAKS